MSQAEDYLDGLLNSINKAKTDAEQVEEKAERKQQEFVESRNAIKPDEDFFTATGIDVQQTKTKSSHPYLRKVLSEDDFLRNFEEELESQDVDSLITDFEQELDDEERRFEETGEISDSEDVVEKLLSNIDTVVTDAKKQLDEEENIPEPQEEAAQAEEMPELEVDTMDSADVQEEQTSDDSDESHESDDQELSLPGDDEIDLSQFIEEGDEESLDSDGASSDSGESGDDDFGFSLDDAIDESGEEEPLDESLKEFMPDDMDALDEAEFGDGEEPDLSGEGDLDLDNILEGEDEDLMDIQSLLNGDEEGAGEAADIDESAEEGEAPKAEEGGKGKKKKKEKKAKKEKGEKKPNAFLQKLALIIFGAPDEEELAEEAAEAAAAAEAEAAASVEITYDEEGNPIIPEGGAAPAPDDKKKKKKEKKEKEKKEKPPKEKKEKPAKAPKPKKEKKPKEPDNSPKIPISIIATFLVLSISIIGVVMVGMTFTGLKRHMSQARELFDQGNYIAAYEKLNGFDLGDEKVLLLRNQARTLADLQQCQDEYTTFMDYKMYNYALDSLLKGLGRYEKYKDDAVEYGISDEYEAYGNSIIIELEESFGLSVDEAMAIYKQPNRHYYTIELRKVLRKLGLPDT